MTLAAMVAVSADPAFAQRETRPETGGVVPDGDIGIPSALLYPDGIPEEGLPLPDDFTGQISVTLP